MHRKFALVLLPLTLTVNTAWAGEKIPCTNFKLIDDLKVYLKCQSSAKIDSCRDLNAEVKLITGEHAPPKKMILSDAEKKEIQDLARHPHELEEILKSATSMNALLGISASKGVVKFETDGAAEIREKIIDIIKENVSDEIRTKLTRVGAPRGAAAGQRLFARAAAQMSEESAKKIVERAIASGVLLVNPVQGLEGLSESAAGTLVGKALGFLAGPVATLIAMTKPTACDAPGEVAINVQSKISECRPEYEINENVARFLVDTPEAQQAALLKNDKVCAFYQKLHAKLFDQPKITGLTCRGESIVMTGKTAEGKTLEVDLAFRGSLNTAKNADGLIKQIYIREDGAVTANPLVMGDGTFKTLAGESQSTLDRVMLSKLYVPAAVGCCANKNDQEHTRCMASYNSGAGGMDNGGGGLPGPTDSTH